MNRHFTDVEWHDINEKAEHARSVRAEIMRLFINGHSLYEEAAFYELYVSDQVNSKQGLDRFIQERIPEFPGKVTRFVLTHNL